MKKPNYHIYSPAKELMYEIYIPPKCFIKQEDTLYDSLDDYGQMLVRYANYKARESKISSQPPAYTDTRFSRKTWFEVMKYATSKKENLNEK